MKAAATEPADERATERMNFRVRPRIKQAIRRAAALKGLDESAFTLDAAYREALDTIATHERMTLQAIDTEAFFSALDNPAPPTARMVAAVKHYREAVGADERSDG